MIIDRFGSSDRLIAPLESANSATSLGGEGVQMTEPAIRDFHAHIYFDASEVDRAQALAATAQDRFGVAVGHFHQRPVGPHPRGSVQMTVPTDRFGEVATWLAVNRGGLTIFAHASTGNDRADHSHNVVWFGPSEPLKLSIFD
jgi:aromatic ring-cleaving dioxygenase